MVDTQTFGAPMGRWDDEIGMMWQDAVRERGVSTRIVSLPPSDWTPPTELPSLKGHRIVSLDTETKDPDLKAMGPGFRRGAKVIGISIALENGYRGYFPFGHEGGGNLEEATVKQWALRELNHFDGELVGANIGYDLDGLEEWAGITFPNVKVIHDVQIAEPLLDEWRLQYNLDALSMDYLGEGKEQELLDRAALAYGWQTETQRKSNLYKLHSSYVGPYAEGDADRPLRILPLQLKKLEEEGLLHIYELERKLIRILVAMRRRGVRVNVEKAISVKASLLKRKAELIAEARRLAGTARLELMQPETFYKALEARGLTVPRTPKTKAPSIKKDFLERYQSDELVNTIWQGRKLDHLINNTLDGQIINAHVNGRIHCSFNQLKGEEGGTIARFSSSHPNLQNVPARDEELAPLVRGMFIPEEGEVWQRDDYDQVEYRLLAHFAVGRGAEEARRRYSEDPKTDFHKYVAGQMGIDPEDKIKRKRVKNVNFAKGYGARGPRLATIMNCTVEEAEEFIKQYDIDLPFAKDTFDACQKWMKKRGFVVTILGRKQRCSLWEPFNNWGEGALPPLPHAEALKAYGPRIQRYMTYAAMNRKFQGSGADIMKKAMVDGWEAGICNVIGPYGLTVHDELDNSIPQTRAGEEAGRELSVIMANVVQMKVPLIVGTDRGTDWGACG